MYTLLRVMQMFYALCWFSENDKKASHDTCTLIVSHFAYFQCSWFCNLAVFLILIMLLRDLHVQCS